MTAEPLRTTDGAALRVETQPSLPGLGGLYARGAAASGRIAAGRALPSLPIIGTGRTASDRPADHAAGGDLLTLPDVAYRVPGVTTADLARHLHEYQRLLHEPVGDVLPAGYLHVLVFPLATAVMVRGDFPLPLLGMVHLRNVVELRGPVRLGDVLEVRAWAENLRAHRRGVQVDLVTEIRPDDAKGNPDPLWRGVSTYLAKGFELPGSRSSTSGAGEVPRGYDSATAGTTSRGETWLPPLPTGRWALGPGTGRAYGAVSGDRNPIHLSALSAKAFGFPRAIAHGMYTAARALADVGHVRGDAYRWTVEFAKPVLLPGTVDMAITPETDGFAYVGWNARRHRQHFSGAVTPL
ncbi:MaoC family dehydratase [Isoptericola croceus]|uniref:MaoC family dehydratase n=1 Tax=Isoptericola croceus TaxID=3031406 RepID=UPI0023F61C59|nr:MaoC/PaaZ C-terminal domain-containing protein [Isoptericola croceus]